MNLSGKIIVPVAVVAAVAILGAGAIYAQTPNGSNLAQAIAQKFNLDQNQVQQTIDQFRSQKKEQMQQDMQQREDKRLSDLVSQGKITNDQKTAIENELQSLKNKYLSNTQNQTMPQRKQAMQNFKNDFQSFLKSQNIDPSIIKPFGMGMGRRGFGKWRNPSPTATPQS